MQEPKLTEGPLGFPVTDRQAIALDTILKALPKDDAFRYRKAIVTKGPSEVLPGERSDVSWISTEDPDRVGDVVLAKGMNDSQFKLNPVVTLDHNYKLPSVGKSLWRKVVKVTPDGQQHGVKAKTIYPAKPAEWPDGKEWPPDIAFSLLQAGLLQGKSIGLLPTKVHFPSQTEIDRFAWKNAKVVIDEWLLLEYCCCTIPVNQGAIVEQISKAALTLSDTFLEALGLKGAVSFDDTPKADPETSWDGDAATKRVKDWAAADQKKYQRAFAWCDPDGNCKLPHHDIQDGKLVVVYKGVVAALAALNGARGGVDLPESDKQSVYNHLAKHYQQFGQEAPELKSLVLSKFTPLEEIEKAFNRQIDSLNIKALADQVAQDALDRMRGKV